MRPARRHHPLHHPAALAAAAVVGLVGSYLVAIRRPVPQAELDLTRTINDAPDALAHALWPVMQLGSVFGPVVVALAVLAFVRDKLLAATVFVKQHAAIDVLAGLLTGAIAYVFVYVIVGRRRDRRLGRDC